MARIILTNETATILAAAIVKCAADDYRQARYWLKKKDITELQRSYYELLKGSAVRFFKSEWCYQLGGEPWMFKRIKRECDRGYYRRSTWEVNE